MNQEISASTIFKVVEVLIIASLLVLLPGSTGVLRESSQSTGVEMKDDSTTTVQVIENVENEQ